MFNLIFVQPLFNALVFLYENVTFKDLGLAIIALTALVRLVLYPLFYKSIKNQAQMQKIQPELKRIQVELKDDKEKQALAMMDLWKKNKVNPFTGIILLIIQLPIIFAIFKVFRLGFTDEAMANLYSFIPRPEVLNHFFLGLIDLTKPNMIILILTTIITFIQIKLSLARNGANQPGGKAGKQMVYILPAVTFIIFLNLPAALGLYVIVSSLFHIFQQYIVNKKIYGTAV